VLKLNRLALVDKATVVVTSGLDDALYAAGGLTLVLEWFGKAETERSLELAIELFVEAVKGSWRLSEEGGTSCASSASSHFKY
jgi:hypothetical protein